MKLDREQAARVYPWLHVEDDGGVWFGPVETDAEADRRLIIVQELMAGRVVLVTPSDA